jgi:hypothetical protein
MKIRLSQQLKNLTLATLLLGSSASAFAAPSLLNGSFESAVITNRFDITSSANAPTSWNYSGAGGHFLRSGQLGIDAQNGSQYVNFGSNGENTANLNQSVTGLNLGERYQVSFWLTLQQLPSTSVVTESIDVSLGSLFSQRYQVTGNTPVWTQFSFDFTADASTSLLSFKDVADPGDVGFNVGLDNIAVRSLTAQVPAPASLSLLAFGLLLAYGKKRKLGDPKKP